MANHIGCASDLALLKDKLVMAAYLLCFFIFLFIGTLEALLGIAMVLQSFWSGNSAKFRCSNIFSHQQSSPTQRGYCGRTIQCSCGASQLIFALIMLYIYDETGLIIICALRDGNRVDRMLLLC